MYQLISPTDVHRMSCQITFNVGPFPFQCLTVPHVDRVDRKWIDLAVLERREENALGFR